MTTNGFCLLLCNFSANASNEKLWCAWFFVGASNVTAVNFVWWMVKMVQKCANVNTQMNPLKLFVCMYVLNVFFVSYFQWFFFLVFCCFFKFVYTVTSVSSNVTMSNVSNVSDANRDPIRVYTAKCREINCNEQMETILCQVCCGVAHINISPFRFFSVWILISRKKTWMRFCFKKKEKSNPFPYDTMRSVAFARSGC